MSNHQRGQRVRGEAHEDEGQVRFFVFPKTRLIITRISPISRVHTIKHKPSSPAVIIIIIINVIFKHLCRARFVFPTSVVLNTPVRIKPIVFRSFRSVYVFIITYYAPRYCHCPERVDQYEVTVRRGRRGYIINPSSRLHLVRKSTRAAYVQLDV